MIDPKWLISLVMSVALPGAAHAQRAKGADLADEVAACRSVAEDTPRLACFDRAAGRLAAAQAAGDLMIVDRKVVVERRRRAFGLPAANAMAAADVRGAEVKQVTGTIRDATATRSPGQYRLILADGTAWEMLDPGQPPQSGETVTITATTLGGFRAKVGRGRAFMVKRLR